MSDLVAWFDPQAGYSVTGIIKAGMWLNLQFSLALDRDARRLQRLQWNPDFLNPRFPEPPDISNQFLFPLDLLHSSSIMIYNFTPGFSNPRILETLDNSNLRKFPNHLVRMPITFTPLNKLGTSSTRNVSQITDQSFSVAKRQQVITIFSN